MTKTEILKEYLSDLPDYESLAFHCPELKDMCDIVKSLYDLGCYWAPDIPYSDAEVEKRWMDKKKNTCVTIGTKNVPDKRCLFNGRMGMYVNQGRVIVEVSELFADASEDISKEQPVTSEPEISEEKPDANVKICPQCKSQISSKAKFCTSCGYNFSASIKNVENNTDNDNPPQPNPVIPEKPTPPVNANNINQDKKKSVLETLRSKKSDMPEKKENIISKEPAAQTRLVTTETHNDDVAEENKNDKRDMLNNVSAVTSVDSVQEKAPAKANISDAKTTDRNNFLCSLLGLKPYEEFKISNNFYNSTNSIFRINEFGFREVKVGHDLWFVCNNEQELSYLISNPESIIKI